MNQFVAVISTLCVVGLPIPAVAQVTPDLDTRFLQRPDPGSDFRGITPTPPPPGKPPIAVRLLRIDPITCYWGEEITFDVEIRNISSQPLTLPWTLLPPTAPLPAPTNNVFPVLRVFLDTVEILEGAIGNVTRLYGDPADSLTTRQVAPGTAVVIRVGTTCKLPWKSSGKEVAPMSARSVTAIASVSLARSDQESGFQLHSGSMHVTITRP